MGKKLGRPRKTGLNITPEKASVWAQRKLGHKSPDEIAKLHGKSRRQVDRDYFDFDAFIRESPEYREATDRMIKMLPKACDVYERKMDSNDIQQGNPDVTVATNVFKATGLIAERKIIDGNLNLGNMSNDDLARHISAIIATIKKPEGEDSQADSGTESPES